MNEERDLDLESKDTVERQYFYQFDYEVMHKYMLRTFEPHVRKGPSLELGPFEGAFSQRLLEIVDDLTCVEGSEEAAEKARDNLGSRATIHCATFEDVELGKKFTNIFMTHVLEHLDNPVNILRRVNEEWLEDEGRFFLVCPNANAPSRQIAVHMGLISHNSAVTPAEHEHGHRITYSLDTLERDVRAAGLEIEDRGGVFFKALANFQFDRLLGTDIISDGYLEGCYQLGQVYPDLCASIFLLCRKG